MAEDGHALGTAGAISLRSHNIGGGISNIAQISPQDLFEAEDRAIVLVHGFNVTVAEADESYAQFERGLSKATRSSVVRLYWPGDTSTRSDRHLGRKSWLSSKLSAASYPMHPERADVVAQKIRDILHRQINRRRGSAPLELIVVAHSLGCFLSLLLLDKLLVLHGNKLNIRLVTLMAAAVPRYAVEERGRLSSVIAGLAKVWILYSPKDFILRWIFPFGQVLERPAFAGWQRSMRGAIGYRGLPTGDGIHAVRGEWGHSDYWKDPVISEAVNEDLSAPDADGIGSLSRRVVDRAVAHRHVAARELS